MCFEFFSLVHWFYTLIIWFEMKEDYVFLFPPRSQGIDYFQLISKNNPENEASDSYDKDSSIKKRRTISNQQLELQPCKAQASTETITD